jgi:hypothetical protein
MPSSVLQDVQAGQFVARRVDLVFNVAKAFYTRVESSSPLVKKSLDSFDRQTEWLSRPIVSKLSAVSQPVIARLDTGLASAYTQIDTKVLKPSQKLQEDIVTVAKAGKEKVSNVHDLTTFYQAAVDALHSVADAARSRASANGVTFEEFVNALQARFPGLHAQWESKFVGPALAFYVEAQSRLSGLGARAENIVSSALEHYKANMNLEVPQLVEGMKTRLGSLWNDGLYQPLSVLFNNIKRTAVDDIRRLQASTEQRSEEVRKFVSAQWVHILQATSNTVDVLLPASAPVSTTDDKDQVPTSDPITVTELAKRVSTRLGTRAATQWKTVRSLAPIRVRSALPEDLIAYANQLIERVDAAYHPLQRVEQVRAACKHSVEYSQNVCKQAVGLVESRLLHLRTRVHGAVSQFASVANARLEQLSPKEVQAIQKDLALLCQKTLRREDNNQELRQLQTDAAALFKRMSVALQTVLRNKQSKEAATASDE